MALRQTNPFDTPIPGQSLTDKPGNYPWEHAAKYSTVEDAGLHILNKLTKNKEIMERVVFLLSAGISVESLTKSIIFSGFVEGAFSPDVGLLLVPRVSKMIFTLGEGAGLKKIKINPPRRNKTKDLINSVLASTMVETKVEEGEFPEEEPEMETKGLMSKPKEE
tara:strand:+ start:395 stop:886 length:492 start_codon:yes stop_codon:yes gene_type:complete